ncbi:MAG TPA: ABC transporter ATP-binding protein [Syntrophorhabdaceae bacterium]|jgi:branched-chain amino acid transport system ATP-binding protein
MTILELNDVYVNYNHIKALQGISLKVGEGEIVALIGANGAGKSTALNAISGVLKITGGTIKYEGKDIAGHSPQAIVRSGIVQVPEGRAILTTLKVRENLEMGAFTGKSHRLKEDMEAVFTRFPVLRKKQELPAGNLSGGEQQMLALGRALMARPRLLLMDEPSMGLSPILVREIFHIIAEINTQGTSILLVEQNARMALEISQRGYVIETGRIALEDTSANLLHNEKVIHAYLGG